MIIAEENYIFIYYSGSVAGSERNSRSGRNIKKVSLQT